MKQELQRAQAGVEAMRARRGSAFYPGYHLAPPAGWMNDPNGLIWFGGQYHAFYQHHPYSADWGPMHWGHATSEDMVHWQQQPIALAPGDEEDRDGCFSGSAVDDDGVLSLIYTGHVWLDGEGNDSAIREVQCLATSRDGIHFEKQGAVLLPPEGIMHFRDPKVWRQDGAWWMVIGARDRHDSGQVLLYRGSSLRDWTFDRVLAGAKAGESYMWECPDFFPLGEQQYLMFSPQGMRPDGYDYRNRFQSGVIAGRWLPGGGFTPQSPFRELDRGHDFYAPQSFSAADGRRVIIAWMDMWESPMPSKLEGWAGCMTVARELKEVDGELRQLPVAELLSLRRQATAIEAGTLVGERQLADGVKCHELLLTWDTQASDAEHYGVRLGNSLRLYVDNQARRLVLWRDSPDAGLDGYRSIPLPGGVLLSLRIFFDSSSVEVFVNDGEAVLSSRIYPREGDRALRLYAAHGEAMLCKGELWALAAIQAD